MFGWFKRKKTMGSNGLPPRPDKQTSPISPPPARSSGVVSQSTQSQATSTDDGFATSMALGYMLNDGIVGGLLGGNIAGGIVGDAMNTSDETPVRHDPAPEVSSPTDYSSYSSSDHSSSSSYDRGSSYDYGSSDDSGSSSSGGDW
jgi:hypothetical protein